MRVITWNVNGIRSIVCKQKDGNKHPTPIKENVLYTLLDGMKPDVVCLQEIKCSADINNLLDLQGLGYRYCEMNCATSRKGYSGTCILSKVKPLSVTHGFGLVSGTGEYDDSFDNEGRVITIELANIYIVNVYTPNSKADLSRLDYRINKWDNAFRAYCMYLQEKKPIIVCGDLNVAPNNIDVHNPKSAKGSHGFTIEERESFGKLLSEANLVDTYRVVNKDMLGYSWFSPFAQSRKHNKGWRIDFILLSKILEHDIVSSMILSEYYGSDHIPCSLDLRTIA